MLTLRPVAPDDHEFLFSVYASTRTEELALTDWDDARKAGFLRMQFNAQHAYYIQHYATASFQVIELDGQPIGRLYVDRWPAEIRIVDIALLPQWRNQGIGTRLLEDILAQADQAGMPVTIHVEMFNLALSLYTRLGFAPVDTHGVYYLLRREPAGLATHVADRSGNALG